MRDDTSIQAVILAGGLGTRLWPLTRDIPKPMIPVAGVPYLEHQFRFLRSQGIVDILLLVGHLGGQIEDYFGDGSAAGLTIRYCREQEPLGTGGALFQAAPLLNDDFLILYGDSFLPIGYRDIHRRLAAGAAEAVIAVYDNRLEDTGVPNNIAFDGELYVTRYEKNAVSGGLTHVDAGVLAMRRPALRFCEGGRAFSLENELYPGLIARRSLLAYPTAQRFYDIGTPAGLRRFESIVSS